MKYPVLYIPTDNAQGMSNLLVLFSHCSLRKENNLQGVPQKGLGSAVCVQRDRYICVVYIVLKTADPNPFQGTHCISKCSKLLNLQACPTVSKLLYKCTVINVCSKRESGIFETFFRLYRSFSLFSIILFLKVHF